MVKIFLIVVIAKYY